jgi:hypothetical protein
MFADALTVQLCIGAPGISHCVISSTPVVTVL